MCKVGAFVDPIPDDIDRFAEVQGHLEELVIFFDVDVIDVATIFLQVIEEGERRDVLVSCVPGS